jgi:hypothetical protein
VDNLTSAHLLAAAAAVELRIAVLEEPKLTGLPEAQDWTAREVARLRECKAAFEEAAHERHTWNDPTIGECRLCEQAFTFYAGYPA